MYRNMRKYFLFLSLTCVILILVSLALGRKSLSVPEIWSLFGEKFGFGVSAVPQLSKDIFWEIRFPRVFAAAVVGASTSVCGSLYQGLFRNPMVSPDILGVSSGASLGTILALAVGLPFLAVKGIAFIFGIGAVALTWTISRIFRKSDGGSGLTILLTGLIVASFIAAIYTSVHFILEMNAKNELNSVLFWSLGA